MGGYMKLRVRVATKRELGLFRKLWKKFLTNQLEHGGDIAPSPHNMSLYDNMFNHYTENPDDGVILFVAEGAVLMWGSAGDSPFDSLQGRVATAWGVFVDEDLRGQGVGKLMREKAKELLKEQGFDTVLGYVLNGNEHGLKSNLNSGFKEVGKFIKIDLNEGE